MCVLYNEKNIEVCFRIKKKKNHNLCDVRLENVLNQNVDSD